MVTYLQNGKQVDPSLKNKDGLTAYEVARKMYKESKKAGEMHKQNMKLLRPEGSSCNICSCSSLKCCS